jgi:hypothetical protein
MKSPTTAADAPVIRALRAVAQFALVSQFAAIVIVSGLPPSTTTMSDSVALLKSNPVNPSPVAVPAVPAEEKSNGVKLLPV